MLALARHVRIGGSAQRMLRLSPLRSVQCLALDTCASTLHRMCLTTAAATTPAPHFFERVLEHQSLLALVEPARHSTTSDASATASTALDAHDRPREWKYAELLAQALVLRDELTAALRARRRHQSSTNELRQPRIAFLGARDASYVVIQWAIWLAGAIAVPLHPRHPVDELEYILSDSDAALVVASASFATSHLSTFLSALPTDNGVPVLMYEHSEPHGAARDALSSAEAAAIHAWIDTRESVSPDAHIVYTSGTTGRPKGVVTTHASLTAQIHDVVSAWEMARQDHLLHFLPLHHVHGVLNNLLCVHYVGGSLEFLPSAQPPLIWAKLAESQRTTKPVTMLMAVPTVYMLLLEEMERVQQLPSTHKHPFAVDDAVRAARNLRVAISGSMACPVSILTRWQALTGQQLLERYGMTELGMVLTNPLHGERHFGYVGQGFPSVSVRLVDPESEQEIDRSSEREGELRVKGPTVFAEYWNKPDATAKEFDADGWFKTGDIAQFSNEWQSFRIRGRASADIIKSAGYKISALDVERVLLTHPQVQECAVFGLPNEKWGQVVAAVIRSSTSSLQRSEDFSPSLPGFVKPHLADYAAPRAFFVVSEIPKNAMGKVNKKSLAAIFQK